MTGGNLIVVLVVQAAISVGLLFIGSWGWGRAGTLPPRHMGEEERAHRAAVMKRGSGACIVVGFIIAASVVYGAADAWGSW